MINLIHKRCTPKMVIILIKRAEGQAYRPRRGETGEKVERLEIKEKPEV